MLDSINQVLVAIDDFVWVIEEKLKSFLAPKDRVSSEEGGGEVDG